MLSLFTRDVLDEIWDLFESVSEGFSTYFSKYQSQPMGFEMPGSDDYWYAILGKQDHLWVYWLHPLDLCKAL